MKKMSDFWGSHVKKIPLQGLLCLLVLCFSFPLFAQQTGKAIDINVKDATVKEILEIIKKHDYRLVYSTAVIDACKKKVTMNLKKATVSQVLDEAFKDTELSYKVEGNLITIKEVQKDKSITAKGVVKDEKGQPLPGVSVIIKGTTVGTATNGNGEFEIRVPENSVLLFSFIGMEAKPVLVESDKLITVVMKEVVNEMDEVVITGYQIINKRESTSSISTLKAEDIIEPVGNSLDQMLQGKVPGMSVMQMTSTVGAAPKIRIRGSSTIIGNREPVWVLDGVVLTDPVPLDATELNSMDRVNLIGNAISGLNPEDIDRIDVLKDASATALYGSKAANGVIVITTKRGKVGRPSVRYSTSMSFIERPSYKGMDLMNSKERIEVSEEIHNRGLAFTGFAPDDVGYEGALRRLWDGKISIEQFYGEVKKLKEVNTDWYDLLFRNSFSHSHTLSVSGGTEKATYYFSVGYSNQQGAQLQEQGERFNFMTNLNFKLSDRLSVSTQLAASMNTTDRPTEDLYKYAYNTSRAIPAYNEDGSYYFYGVDINSTFQFYDEAVLQYNIFNELRHSGATRKTRSINTQLNIDYKVASWLNLNGVFSYNTSTSEADSYYDEQTYKVSTYRGLPYGFDRSILSETSLKSLRNDVCQIPYGGILSSSSDASDSFTMRMSLNASKMFNEVHSVSLAAGIEVTSNKYKGYSKEEWGYLPERGKQFTVLENLEDWPEAAESMLQMKPIISDNTANFLSYYATASYSFQGKYVFSANVRGDGSNKLGEEARFLPVWSLSGRWNLTNEPWMNFVENVFSNIDFRVSYGIQANVTDAHNPNMIIALGKLYPNSEEYAASLLQLPNLDLEWEKTNSFNFGVDFDLFKGKLVGSFDYYKKKSKDQLMSVEVESTNGGKIVTINGGDLTNKGWDLALSFTPVRTEDFEWQMTFNTGKVYNEVSNAADRTVTYSDYLNGTVVKNGYALNSFYSYQFDGLDENGLPKFKGLKDYDEQGNVVITTRAQALASALKYSGKREPNISGGLSMSFRYRRLSLNTRFALSLGNKIRLNDLYVDEGASLPYPAQNMSSEFVNRWQKKGDENKTNIPVLSDQSISISSMNPDNKGMIMNGNEEVARNYWQMYNDSDLRVVSGNFLRCNNISLTYALSDEIAKKLYVKGASFSLGVSNPFVLKSKDLKGRDPEQVTLGSGTLPPQQTYSLMLNITF
ncbi:SusC/RagA family TonB-linked outer membrane protein [uncultured Butyricimonas sp.]|uniref:SusC/RagA family TonB-linked outer membrane protein n=1 Tax=uncultured Butyricimonas sp. TaxID=1268785 RepID=UPI0026DCE76F|nr:SusC/RagA family TonB-linked outer membrane protein [uncultured Butyricimonas sp.]